MFSHFKSYLFLWSVSRNSFPVKTVDYHLPRLCLQLKLSLDTDWLLGRRFSNSECLVMESYMAAQFCLIVRWKERRTFNKNMIANLRKLWMSLVDHSIFCLINDIPNIGYYWKIHGILFEINVPNKLLVCLQEVKMLGILRISG